MRHRKTAVINAIVFFVFWLLVLLAGADKPPPPGFIWIGVAVTGCAAVVAWRVPAYIEWSRTRRAGRRWLVLLDGMIAGLLLALVFALNGSGEPSVTTQPVGYAIWFVVLAVMGMLNSVTIYAINAWAAKRASRTNSTESDNPR